MHDRCADPFLIPSQLLVVDVLQRPLEFTQYTALAFAKKLEDFDITASMESRGDAYDNAAAESFMAIIKTELTKRCRFANHMQARTAIFDYIEGFYNRAVVTPPSATRARSTSRGSTLQSAQTRPRRP